MEAWYSKAEIGIFKNNWKANTGFLFPPKKMRKYFGEWKKPSWLLWNNLNIPHPMATQELCCHDLTNLSGPESSAGTPLLLGPVQKLSVSTQETKGTKILHLFNTTDKSKPPVPTRSRNHQECSGSRTCREHALLEGTGRERTVKLSGLSAVVLHSRHVIS